MVTRFEAGTVLIAVSCKDSSNPEVTIWVTIRQLYTSCPNPFLVRGQMCVCVCVCGKSLQLCLILCNPMDCSLPGSSVHCILQARILEWVAIPFSRDLPNPGFKRGSPALQADALPSEPPGKPWVNRSKGSLLSTLWWPEGEGNLKKRAYMHTYANSLCCTAESNTTRQSNCTS